MPLVLELGWPTTSTFTPSSAPMRTAARPRAVIRASWLRVRRGGVMFSELEIGSADFSEVLHQNVFIGGMPGQGKSSAMREALLSLDCFGVPVTTGTEASNDNEQE